MFALYNYVCTSGKKKKRFEQAANEIETLIKQRKKQFPGLCIPDDEKQAQTLLYNREDEKVAKEALNEVRTLSLSCDW